MVAAAAKKIFTGEKIAPFKTVSVDQASWFLTHGEGFGKAQYRYNSLATLAPYFLLLSSLGMRIEKMTF